MAVGRTYIINQLSLRSFGIGRKYEQVVYSSLSGFTYNNEVFQTITTEQLASLSDVDYQHRIEQFLNYYAIQLCAITGVTTTTTISPITTTTTTGSTTTTTTGPITTTTTAPITTTTTGPITTTTTGPITTTTTGPITTTTTAPITTTTTGPITTTTTGPITTTTTGPITTTTTGPITTTTTGPITTTTTAPITTTTTGPITTTTTAPITTTTTAPITTTTTIPITYCYGELYNYYAATNSSFISTIKAHIPSIAEWNTLTTYIGGLTGTAHILKEIGITHWSPPNTGALNSYGFTALPAGARSASLGAFTNAGLFTNWWTDSNYTYGLSYLNDDIFAGITNRKQGASIRLIIDTIDNQSGNYGTYTGNDGKIYPCVYIPVINQWWLATNLSETQYRDHSAITLVTVDTTWAGLTTEARSYYNNDVGYGCIPPLPVTTTTTTAPTTTTTTAPITTTTTGPITTTTTGPITTTTTGPITTTTTGPITTTTTGPITTTTTGPITTTTTGPITTTTTGPITTTTTAPITTTTTVPVTCHTVLNSLADGKVYTYDYTTNIATLLATLPNSVDVAMTDTKLWVYAVDQIFEYNIVSLSPLTISGLSRVISKNIAHTGNGLTSKNNTTLIIGGYTIYQLDITTTTAVETTLFTLPDGGYVAGDIYYVTSSDIYIITYYALGNSYIGKFTSSGTLLVSNIISLDTPYGLFSINNDLYVANSDGGIWLVDKNTLSITYQKTVSTSNTLSGAAQTSACMNIVFDTTTTTSTTAPPTTTTTTNAPATIRILFNDPYGDPLSNFVLSDIIDGNLFQNHGSILTSDQTFTVSAPTTFAADWLSRTADSSTYCTRVTKLNTQTVIYDQCSTVAMPTVENITINPGDNYLVEAYINLSIPTTTTTTSIPTTTTTTIGSCVFGTGSLSVISDAFIFTVQATPSLSVTLPTPPGYTYSYTVDWGDGSAVSPLITTYFSTNATHVYTNAGSYNISIRGVCGGFYCQTAPIRTIITNIVEWGTNGDFRSLSFSGCVNLTTIPNTPLTSVSNITSLNSLFTQCSSLLGPIPDGFFDNAPNVTDFSYTFEYCSSISGSIPVDLFKYNTNVAANAFAYTFFYCSGLSGLIPTDLFRYNTLASTSAFNGTFGNCSKLSGSIPIDLFRYNTLVSSFGFYGTFDNCINLSGSIPTDLFRYNTLVSSWGFFGTFGHCGSLSGSIPTDLFRYNTLADNFIGVFNSCAGITGSIPVDLFRYNTLATNFGSAFTYCLNMSGAIPTGLFKYNTLATNFSGAFYECQKLQITKNIFYDDGSESTRFLNQSVNFGYCFFRSSAPVTQGTAPNLWICAFGSGTPTTTLCFGNSGNNSTSLSNYASIPGGWK